MGAKKLSEGVEFNGNMQETLQWMLEQERKAKQIAADTGNEYVEPTYDIALHRKARSLKANAYAWQLISKIADRLNNTKQEIYKQCLANYGQSYLIELSRDVPESEVERLFKYYEVMEETSQSVVYKVYLGTSLYDTKEMAVYIDGVVSEAKTLGISTLTPDEIKDIKDGWGVI